VLADESFASQNLPHPKEQEEIKYCDFNLWESFKN